jgi:hypothetical protein
MHTKFWSENVNERDDLEDLEENNIKVDIKERGREGVDWIHLAQDRD